MLLPKKADSLIVINWGTVGIPLALFRFGTGNNMLSGSEWGIDILQPGQCVTVIKGEGKFESPGGDQCVLVGKHLVRSGPEKFWAAPFDVYFQGVSVATCDTKKTLCDFLISKSP
jgi:hypothetical protein